MEDFGGVAPLVGDTTFCILKIRREISAKVLRYPIDPATTIKVATEAKIRPERYEPSR